MDHLNRKIESLVANGPTNHASAFNAASILLSKGTGKKKAVMFTDGLTTVGGDALPFAQKLKNQGVEVFCIGLLANPSQIRSWVSDPKDDHMAYTDDLSQLSRVFEEITADVVEAGARDVVIREELQPDFRVTRVLRSSNGKAEITGGQTLVWTIDAAGLESGRTTTSLTLEIVHIGEKGGIKEVNRSLTYRDWAGHKLTFPSPTVTVNCPEPEPGPAPEPEPGPEPLPLAVPGCRDAVRLRVECTVKDTRV